MNHRIQIRLLNSFAILFVSMQMPICLAYAQGGQDGGGGNVIRCEAEDDVIQVVWKKVRGQRVLVKVPPRSILPDGREFQLMDLWEAENGFGPFEGRKLTLVQSQQLQKTSLIAYALKRASLVSAELAIELERQHAHVTARMSAIPTGTYVIPPEDTDIRFLPRGCHIHGFGAYSDRADNLVYDPKIMAKLPAIDIAAFEIHEAIYRYLRLQNPNISSWDTRRMVGLLFAREAFTLEQFLNGFDQRK